jgi:hypothetical protein
MEAKSLENSVPAPLIMELHQRMGFPLAYCKSALEKVPAHLQRHFVEFQTGTYCGILSKAILLFDHFSKQHSKMPN